MKEHPYSARTIGVALATALLLTACGSREPEGTPTLSSEQVQTQAVVTFEAALTATALSIPTETPTTTQSPTAPVISPQAATSTPTVGVTPVDACLGMRYVSDVTIPDDTEMSPGQEFTKTWRVRNSGSCAWEQGFELAFTGGEAMEGSTLELDDEVEPGEQEDLSVELTAPDEEGTYRGNWRMRNASGAYFGDEVFVQIVVEEASASATPTTASATAAPSATASPTTGASATPTAAVAPSATPTDGGGS